MSFSIQETSHLDGLIYQGIILRSFYMASCVVFTYDYVLTFPEEIDRIWKRRFTLPTIVFLLLRYITPFELVISLGVFYPQIVAAFSCDILRLIGVLNITIVTLIGCIMTIRTIALYNQNKIILWSLSILMLGQTVMLSTLSGKWSMIAILSANVMSRVQQIFISVSVPSILHISVLTSLWWCPLVTDTIMFCLTVIRLRSLRKFSYQNYSLFNVIMRDGVSYYIVICLLYASNTINWLLSPEISKIAGVTFGLSIPAILICRLTLNLQGVQLESENDTDSSLSGVLTTLPSVFSRPPPTGSIWLTGERWDGICFEYPEDSVRVVEEQEIPMVVRQTTAT